jgi:hypothetical protein
MKMFWIIALCLHLINDKRVDSEIDKTPFIIQTETRII